MITRRSLIAMVAVSITGLAGAAMPAAAQSTGLLVSTEWLAERLDDPGIVILHADGNSTGYDAAHLPGAHFISTGDITVDGEHGWGYELPPVDRLIELFRDAGVTDDSRVVIYAGASPLAATRLWLTFDYLGLGDRASVLDGGLQRWREESRPVTAETPAAGTTGTLTASTRTDMIVSAEWILDRLDDEGTLLIDARPDDEYTGADGGMGGMANPGHIPGAHQMYWEQLIVDRRSDPRFRPLDELRKRFAESGAEGADNIVAYCMVGARASLTYFVGRMLGYDMRFYDGSWHDWGTRDLPYVGGRSPR